MVRRESEVRHQREPQKEMNWFSVNLRLGEGVMADGCSWLAWIG